MTREEFIQARNELGLSQTEFGVALGLSLRGVQKLEAGDSEIRRVHELAVNMVRLERANTMQSAATLPYTLQALIKALAGQLT